MVLDSCWNQSFLPGVSCCWPLSQHLVEVGFWNSQKAVLWVSISGSNGSVKLRRCFCFIGVCGQTCLCDFPLLKVYMPLYGKLHMVYVHIGDMLGERCGNNILYHCSHLCMTNFKALNNHSHSVLYIMRSETKYVSKIKLHSMMGIWFPKPYPQLQFIAAFSNWNRILQLRCTPSNGTWAILAILRKSQNVGGPTTPTLNI